MQSLSEVPGRAKLSSGLQVTQSSLFTKFGSLKQFSPLSAKPVPAGPSANNEAEVGWGRLFPGNFLIRSKGNSSSRSHLKIQTESYSLLNFLYLVPCPAQRKWLMDEDFLKITLNISESQLWLHFRAFKNLIDTVPYQSS